MKKQLNIGLIGAGFMGKAHANAWLNAPRFYDVPYTPVIKAVCAKDMPEAEIFAKNWGISDPVTDWREVAVRPDIDVIDVCTPTLYHHEIVMAAADAGKHIICEKPCAMTTAQAREMAQAADKAGVIHYLNHNYRRVPAAAFARRLIDEGKIGDIRLWRGAYLQDWIMAPGFPLTWQLQKKFAGAGAHYDLNSHSVDLARYLVGELESVSALSKTFIGQRPLPGEDSGVFKAGTSRPGELGDVTVDDAFFMTASFENGAIGSFEASRLAGGRRNGNCFEIYGSKGSIAFNLERMNELEYISLSDPRDDQGFRTIQVTNSSHPYMEGWWAPGHIIGYSNTFIHVVKDFLSAVKNGGAITPNLWDGVRIMQALEAGLLSAKEGRAVKVSEI